MSITKVPAVGLQIDMEEYIRLRLSSNGPDFWYPSNQDVLCKMLAPFLPRMTYDAMTNKVTASIVENGRELLSQSEDCSSTPIPAKQLEMFSNLLKGLKSKIESEVVDPDTKSLIKGFKLPDPNKAPEMYRIYGDKRHPRLAILWGMEKVVDSSINVVDMNVAETLTPHAEKSSGKKKWIVILLALAAAGLVWAAAQSDGNSAPGTSGGSSTPGAPAPGTSGGSSAPGAPAPGNSGDSSAPGAPAPGIPVPGTEATPSAGLAQPGETVIPNARDMDELIAPAVWQVLVVKEKEILSTATAFCFDPAGRFITNHHVANHFNDKGVKYILKNDSIEMEVTACPYMDEARDLAVLKVETPKEALPYLRLQKDTKPVRGEAIYVEGYPEGIAKIISQGIVSAVVTDPNTHLTYVLHSAPVSPGSSGSPVVNRKGEVIAVVIGNIPGSTNQAQSLNHAMWIGELDSQHAQQPADSKPIIVPPNVKPAPVNEKGEILGPNTESPEANSDPSQDVPVVDNAEKGEGKPITTPPVAPNTPSVTPGKTTDAGSNDAEGGEGDAQADDNADGQPDGNGDDQTDDNADAQTDSNGDDQTDGNADAQTDGNADGQTDGNGDAQTDGNADAQTDDNADGQPDGNADAQTDGNGDAQTDGNGDAQTDDNGDAQTDDNGDAQTDDNGDDQTDDNADAQPDGSGAPQSPEAEPQLTGTPTPGANTPVAGGGSGAPQPVNGVIGTGSAPTGPVTLTPAQPRPETLMAVSEDRPFSLTKVGQKTLDNGKIDIDLQFNPAPGTTITKASVNEVPVDTKTRRVTITVEAKSQKVPVKVYVQGRKDPYSVDCTINPVKK